MCSIAGWIDYKEDLRERTDAAAKMNASMKRRGPDDSGVFVSKNAILCHNRLTVVDPVGGAQPMTAYSRGEEYKIVYNGELYNTEDVRALLTDAGYAFTSYSDTEVLLLSYIEWGEKCLEKLNGIFAFAIWKKRDNSLFLARDRAGVKPLFYYRYSGGILFASEIKGLLAHPAVKPEVDKQGLMEMFLLGPGRAPGSGVIRGVRELEPGECMRLTEKSCRVKRYWSLKAAENTESMAEAEEHIRDLMTDAITRQTVSDVPLACFLSGGLDSSIISHVVAEKYRSEGKRLTTYSVDYENYSEDFIKNDFQPTADSEFIWQMSQFIGSEHQNIVLNNEEVGKALTESAYARDLPGMADVDSSLLLFCREIKKRNTVCLSGECADEILGGYPWYHKKEILFDDNFPWSKATDMRKNLIAPGLIKGNAEEFVHAYYHATVTETDCLDADDELERRMREMFMLNFRWFMQTLLDRKDRMSMYCGLEVRVPFCDHRLLEYAYNLPWHIKAADGREKGIVRRAFKGILPDSIVYRKKSPYPKSFSPVYVDYVKAKVVELCNNSHSILSDIIDKNYLQTLLNSDPYAAQPWYGQLMRLPQVFAFLIQTDAIFKKYKLKLV